MASPAEPDGRGGTMSGVRAGFGGSGGVGGVGSPGGPFARSGGAPTTFSAVLPTDAGAGLVGCAARVIVELRRSRSDGSGVWVGKAT